MSGLHRVELKRNVIKRCYRDVGGWENGWNYGSCSPPPARDLCWGALPAWMGKCSPQAHWIRVRIIRLTVQQPCPDRGDSTAFRWARHNQKFLLGTRVLDALFSGSVKALSSILSWYSWQVEFSLVTWDFYLWAHGVLSHVLELES